MPATFAPMLPRSVLISGASIAGPALAYWLHRYGFNVTVVERAASVRTGGYPIDVRGSAIEVVAQMGLLPELADAHIAAREMVFVDADRKTLGAIPPYDLTGNEGRDVEVPRGVLTQLMFDLTRTRDIHYRFADSIKDLHDDGVGVDVLFDSGESGRFDVVIGADGLHSNTRRLAFGEEAPFNRFLGYTFNLFSMPNQFGLSHSSIVYAEAGRTAGAFAVGDSKDVFAFLVFCSDEPPFTGHSGRIAQIERTSEIFSAGGWEVPTLVEAMSNAADLYFDTVSQIHMPTWSKGRIALVGDAAFAPSFLSGQGTSLALAGAYVLAGELARYPDPVDAFASYEQILRPYVEANQALATKAGGSILLPRTPAELEARNRLLSAVSNGESPDMPSGESRVAYNCLRLPDYARLLLR